MLAAGVDGCRGGWVVATDEFVVVAPTFRDVLGVVGDGVVAIDIPIGLPEAGSRACDVAARRAIGPRRSSVFPAPVRRALSWAAWPEASGMSKQAFNLLPKIREVDDVMTPALQARVCEAHPELSLATLAGRPMAHPKRTAAGVAERMAALGLSAVPRVPGAGIDDVLDAYAVLWTAKRVQRADERRLGDGAVDAKGLRMEIVV